MIRKLSGLNTHQMEPAMEFNGLFLVRVEGASYCGQRQKPFLTVRFAILEPEAYRDRTFFGRIYCSERALWRLGWFLRDFGYDSELLLREQIDEKALLHLRGIVRTSATRFRGGSYQNLDGFAPASEWEALSHPQDAPTTTEAGNGL